MWIAQHSWAEKKNNNAFNLDINRESCINSGCRYLWLKAKTFDFSELYNNYNLLLTEYVLMEYWYGVKHKGDRLIEERVLSSVPYRISYKIIKAVYQFNFNIVLLISLNVRINTLQVTVNSLHMYIAMHNADTQIVPSTYFHWSNHKLWLHLYHSGSILFLKE